MANQRLLPRTVTGRGFGGNSNTPPPTLDPSDAEMTEDEIIEAMKELLNMIGPDQFAWLVLGVPNANQRSSKRALVPKPQQS